MDNRDRDRFGHGPSTREYAALERLLDGDDPDDLTEAWGGVAAGIARVVSAAMQGHRTTRRS